ncbi:MAG: hypothetical protein KDA79_23555, partial [Planctomycetaceae bacterium]|nr:hypothetical protein [Planctomycetaceae bacterium]
LTGDGEYPLAPGEGQFSFSWANIDVGELAAEAADLPLQLHGIFSGKARASCKVAADGPPGWIAESTFAVPEIRVGEVPAGNIQGTAALRDKLLQFDVGGKLFDGDLDLSGELPLEELTGEEPPVEEPPATPPAAAPPRPPAPAEPPAGDGAALRGRLRMQGMSLSLSLRALGYADIADALGGTLDVEISNRPTSPAERPAGTGRITLRGVQWSGRTVVEEISGDIRIHSGRLVIDALAGELAGGRLRTALVWDLAATTNRQISLQLMNADMGRLLLSAPAPELLPPDLSGRVDLRAVLQRGDRWQAEGTIRLHRVRFGQVELSSLKLGGRAVFAGPLTTGSFSLPTITGSAAAGRLHGRLSGRWGDRLNLDGRLRFSRIDLQSLGLGAGGVGQIGDGRLSGTAEITARNARSLSDSTVLLNASLGRARPGRLPLFTELRPFLPAPAFDGTLDDGLLQARLSRGVMRIEQLSLTGPSLRIYVTGTVTRPDRLNLAVTVATGDTAASRGCSLLSVARLADSANPSVGILLRTQRLLSNRLIHLEVTGTARRPMVRALPLPLLSDEALRYFLEQAAA